MQHDSREHCSSARTDATFFVLGHLPSAESTKKARNSTEKARNFVGSGPRTKPKNGGHCSLNSGGWRPVFVGMRRPGRRPPRKTKQSQPIIVELWRLAAGFRWNRAAGGFASNRASPANFVEVWWPAGLAKAACLICKLYLTRLNQSG